MKLNNREKAWQNKNKKIKESHPTYKQFGKYAGSLEERMQKFKNYDAWCPEHLKEREEFYKEHGRQWQVFDFYNSISNLKQKSWIEDYK
jgi:hypothetical protein